MKHLQPFHLYEAVLSNDEIYDKFYTDIEKSSYDKILSIQPKKRFYKKWLLGLYQHGALSLEDLYKAEEYLTFFDRPNITRLLGGMLALNKYHSIQSLFVDIKPLMDTKKSHNEMRNGTYEETQVAELNDWTIHIPRTYEQSCVMGKGTEWCTATEKTRNHYDSYMELGDLYIVVNKNDPKEKYQFHFELSQLMDVNDKGIELDWFRDKRELALYFENHFKESYYITVQIMLGKDTYDTYDLFRHKFMIPVEKDVEYLRNSWNIISELYCNVTPQILTRNMHLRTQLFFFLQAKPNVVKALLQAKLDVDEEEKFKNCQQKMFANGKMNLWGEILGAHLPTLAPLIKEKY